MSQELQNKIDELTKQNQQLAHQVASLSQGTEVLMAQVESHKGMLNESLTATLNLKTQTLLETKKVTRLQGIVEELNKQLQSVNKSLEDATARILELEKGQAA